MHIRRAGPIASVVLLVIIAGGCSHPSDKAITSFAESTAAIASIAASASDLQIETEQATGALGAAVSFSKKEARQDGLPVATFPPPRGYYSKSTLRQEWRARVVVLKSIGAYAKALAEANDPDLTKPIAETTASLSTALGNFQSALAASSGSSDGPYLSERTQLIGGLVADAASFGAGYYAAVKIREVMRQAHPKLERARDLLKIDLDTVTKGLRAQRNAHQRTLNDKLEAHFRDEKLSTVDRYNLYMEANTQLAALNAKIEIVQESSQGLDAMVEAHQKLMESSDDNRAILGFFSLVQGIAEKAKKLQDLERSHRAG